MPLSGKEMLDRYIAKGWSKVTSHGGVKRKGGHIKVRKGTETAIIPMHKELKTGTEQSLLKKLKKTK